MVQASALQEKYIPMSAEEAARLLVICIGIGVLIGGTVMLINIASTPWTTVNSFSSNMTGLIVGGFLVIIGVLVICAGLGVLREATRAITEVWDSFLGALGRS
jgi:uncharacterized membrane protein